MAIGSWRRAGNNPLPAYFGGGGVSMLDLRGLTEPRLLVPPFGTSCPCLNVVNGVVAGYRPSSARQILTGGANGLSVYDTQSGANLPMGRAALAEFTPYWVATPSWSSDGSAIAFTLLRAATDLQGATGTILGDFVIGADGTGLRRVPGHEKWSPTSLRLGYVSDGDAPRSWIVIYDVDSSDEQYIDVGDEIASWVWAPDGRALLVQKLHDAQLTVIDIATEAANGLPWEVDSSPSWQKISPD